MIETDQLLKIKRLTVSALMSDDILMGILVLKGGNALNLIYDLTDRGSIDIDFSMEKDFSEVEKNRIRNQAEYLLNNEFEKEKLRAFDVRFFERPSKINDEVKSFWGGYCLEFKIISKEQFDIHSKDPDALRRNAIPIGGEGQSSTRLEVDISKYEYIANKRAKDIEGATVYVYSPEMLAIEKLRALCQQIDDYKEIVHSITRKSRARDFYDIYKLKESFSLDFRSTENIDLCKHIFDAKRVPLTYISKLTSDRELHRQSWESVVNTIGVKETPKDFDYYFEYTLSAFNHLY